jgi:hypothetical protein
MLAALEHPTREATEEEGQSLSLGRSVWKGNQDHDRDYKQRETNHSPENSPRENGRGTKKKKP